MAQVFECKSYEYKRFYFWYWRIIFMLTFRLRLSGEDWLLKQH